MGEREATLTAVARAASRPGLALGAGVALGVGLRSVPGLAAVALGLIAVLFVGLRRWADAPARPALGITLLLFAAGLVAGTARAHSARARPLLPALESTPEVHDVVVVGRVASTPELRRAQQPPLRWLQMEVEVEALVRDGRSEPASGTVQTFVTVAGTPPALAVGDRVRLLGDLERPRPVSNPGGFDYGRYLERSGLRGILSVPRGGVLAARPPEAPGWRRRLDAWRGRLAGVLDRHASRDTAAFAQATLLGQRSELDRGLVDAFSRTGTVHILAISGLHTALVAGLALALLRALRVPSRLAALGAIALTVGYCALTGARPSVVRATIMVVVYLSGRVLRREPDALSALGVAAAAILLLDPGDLLSPGFQLSFVAVLGIVLTAGPATRGLRERTGWDEAAGASRAVRRAAAWLGAAACVSLAAWAFTAPLVLWHFHIVTPLAPLVNIGATGVLSAALGLGASIVALGTLWPAAGAGAGWLLDALVGGTTAVVERLASLPGAYAYLPDVTGGQVAAAYALLSLALAAARVRGARAVAVLAALVAPLALWPAGPTPPADGALRLTVLEVSNGSAALVETAGGVHIFDCGSSRILPGERMVAPALWADGYRRVDRVFLSHADLDHVKGIVEVAERFAIGAVHVPGTFGADRQGREILDALRARGVLVEVLRRGDIVDLGGGARAEVMGPPPLDEDDAPPAKARNDRSLVVRVVSPSGSLLLPGDIEEPGTRALLAREEAVASDVLIAPHHGAANADLPALLGAARPRLVVVSARDGFPALKSLEAFRSSGAVVAETSRVGAVLVDLDAAGLRWRGFVGDER